MKPICSAPGCSHVNSIGGLCNKHHQRMLGKRLHTPIVDVAADGGLVLACGHTVYRSRRPVRGVICDVCDPEALATARDQATPEKP